MEKLATIQQEKPVITLGQTLQAMQACKDSMSILQDSVIQNSFSSQIEEINFFKEIKPKFYSLLIFYHRLYNIEVNRPLGGDEEIKVYLKNQLDQIARFFEENRFWYQYHRSGETYLDEKLFLRNRQGPPLSFRIYDINAHPLFSTGFEYIFSRIIANELLISYLKKSLLSGVGDKQGLSFISSQHQLLTWTDPKSALIEFAYAAKAKGIFNNGKATLKEITDYLQLVFNIQLSNPTRDFQEILRRKTGYSNFLDNLRESYLKYIDQLENKDHR
jgi:hypothetical protein